MKAATYQLKLKRGSIYATVTLKDDGKISVSISNPKHYSSAERYQVKQLGIKIAEGGFVDPAIIGTVTSSDDALISKLRKHTVELKAEYIERVKKYAKEYFEFIIEKRDWSFETWLEKYGYDGYKDSYDYDGGRLKRIQVPCRKLTQLGKRYHRDLNTFKSAKGGFTEAFKIYEKSEIDHAQRHYEDSLRKLASRLNAKGINSNTKIEIKKGKVGINLELTIYHGDIVTRAWTIVAAQDSTYMRPHYRYLVK